jgi:outer membrane PBP1 activator LpoA protein
MTSPSPRLSPALAVVALVVAVLAAGCAPSSSSSSNSTSKFKGEARLAAQSVEDLQSAANDSDYTKICTQLLAADFAAKFATGGRACADSVKQAVKDADTIDMTVEQVSVDGDKATAQVKLETGKTDRTASFDLARENGRWKIESL